MKQNGYQLTLSPPGDVQALWMLIEGFRDQATNILYRTLCERVARLAAWVIDQRVLEMPLVLGGLAYRPSDAPLEVAYRCVLRSFEDAYAAGYGAHQELEAHLTVFLGPEVLALLHTRNVAVEAAWEATDGVERFPYLRPPEMDAAEWAVRSGVWQAILDRPSGGLRMATFGRYGLPTPTIEDVLPHVPIRKDRAAELGMDRALGIWLRRQPPQDPQRIPYTVIQGLQWLREDAVGNATAKGEAAEIEPLLPLIDYESFSP
jgi:hypothetical protein